MLRPLGDRVLIRPEPAQERTDSGLWIAEQKKPNQIGTVVAVGTMTHPRKQEAEAAAEWLGRSPRSNPQGSTEQIAELLSALVAREPVVKVGDCVVFSWQAGQDLTVDGERFILMPEGDLLAVLEGV